MSARDSTLGTSTGTAITWGPLISSTVMNYLESGMLRDQVHKNSPLWKWLNEKGRLKTLTGGERIKLPMMHQDSGNFKRYAGLEVLDVSGYDGVTNVFYDWKQAASAVVVSGLDKRANQGESRIRDLTKDKTFQAESALADNLASDAYSDGCANGSKQITGLAAMIVDAPTSGTYATVNSENNDKWRNQVATSVGNAAVNLVPNLRTVYNDCTEIAGVDGEPDGLFMSQTEAETLESLITPAIRYSPGGEGQMSIKPKYRAADVMWEAKCQSGTVYVLNSRHVFLFVHRDANLTSSEVGMQSPVNQDAFIVPILFQGNMGTNLRSALGKLVGIT